MLAMLSFSACTDSRIKAELELETQCWTVADTLELKFSNSDTSAVYQLYFPVVFLETYPYNNVYLRAQVTSPSGDQNILPARFQLSAPNGEWYTEPSGEELPFDLGISDGLRFNQEGEYSIALYQYMQDENLCGVSSVGIVLEEVERN